MKSSAWEITELHDGEAREDDIVTNGYMYSMDGSIAENMETSETRRKNLISRKIKSNQYKCIKIIARESNRSLPWKKKKE